MKFTLWTIFFIARHYLLKKKKKQWSWKKLTNLVKDVSGGENDEVLQNYMNVENLTFFLDVNVVTKRKGDQVSVCVRDRDIWHTRNKGVVQRATLTLNIHRYWASV